MRGHVHIVPRVLQRVGVLYTTVVYVHNVSLGSRRSYHDREGLAGDGVSRRMEKERERVRQESSSGFGANGSFA